MVFEWQMIMSSLDLAIPVIGWQLRRGVTAQKPITNDDSLKMRHIVQPGLYCGGEHIPKYHDINFAICIQPKQAERGILLLPQHYHKLCAHSFSQHQTDWKWNWCIVVHIAWLSLNWILERSWVALYSVVCLSVCLWGIGVTRPNLHFFQYIQAYKPFADPVPPNTKQYQLILTKYRPVLSYTDPVPSSTTYNLSTRKAEFRQLNNFSFLRLIWWVTHSILVFFSSLNWYKWSIWSTCAATSRRSNFVQQVEVKWGKQMRNGARGLQRQLEESFNINDPSMQWLEPCWYYCSIIASKEFER